MRARLGLASCLALAACGTDPGGGADATDPPADARADVDATILPTIPADTLPCDEPAYWPRSVRSTRHAAIVHYRHTDEAAMAAEVLAHLEHAWDVEVGALGFRPPVDDTGACGPDGALDVFLWRGSEGCYVDTTDAHAATAHEDARVYMVVDPWGPYGGSILDTTVAHELNHALQAADDWYDAEVVYEMTATFVEELVHDDDDQYLAQVAEFQARPGWSLDRDDGYETWYMYGAALYLHFVRERYFGGDGAFAGAMWLRLRNPAGADEPDFEDALDGLLRARAGVGFLDSVVELARWRVYTGARDDGLHFEEGARFAEPARAATVRTTGGRVTVDPMTLGTAYVELVRQPGDPATVAIALESASTAVDWVVQAVPGPRLALAGGPAVLEVSGARTIAITALPRAADADPDRRTDTRRTAVLAITPR